MQTFSGTDIPFYASVSKHDIVSYMYNHLYKFGWKTTVNYTLFRPRKFFRKPLLIPEGNTSDFRKYIDYCYLLCKNFNEADEAARYSDKFGTGIYFSTVLYWLLVFYGVVNEKKLRFCQGYFCYKRDDHPSRYRAGLHAWLSHNGSVIDTTIWQQRDHFDFEKRGFPVPVIAGDIPQGLKLTGFEEDKNLVKEYARRFARDSGLTFYDWVKHHKQQADMLYNTG